MIDTVRFHTGGSWRDSFTPSGWSITTNEKDIDGRKDRSRFCFHEDTGLRVTGSPAGPSLVECSLPRILHGSNGRLIRDPHDLQQAVAKVLDMVSKVVESPDAGKLTRLDTVWQFKGDPASWITSLGCARHPSIRSEPQHFFGQSVSWVGTTMCLRIYDKRQETFGKPGDVVRVESQVRGKTLKQLQPVVGSSLAQLQWDGCWKVLRAVVTELPAFKIRDTSRPLSLAGFLAYLQVNKVMVGDQHAEDAYLLARSTRQQRRLRAMMSTASREELITVDPAALFPEVGPPEVVDCVA